jgi:hypothetical protein
MLEKYMPALETEEHDLNVGRDLLGDVKGTGGKKRKRKGNASRNLESLRKYGGNLPDSKVWTYFCKCLEGS